MSSGENTVTKDNNRTNEDLNKKKDNANSNINLNQSNKINEGPKKSLENITQKTTTANTPAGGGGSGGAPPRKRGTGEGGGGSGTQPTPNSPSSQKTTPHVSAFIFEFLLSEILQWVETETESKLSRQNGESGGVASSGSGEGGGGSGGGGSEVGGSGNAVNVQEEALKAAERAAAKIERLGFGVGYRLCERLTQHKPLSTAHPGSSGSMGGNSNATTTTTTTATTNTNTNNETSAASSLEAVKFLCKEFWTEVFRKQVDKLQTNHRGIFVLKDQELRWLARFPPDDEQSRVAAIKMLAFPCGLIRGALNNLGIMAVVSCDFLADGRSMSSCSFNIKIKN